MKLLQRVLGLLIVSFEGSEVAILGLVQRYGEGLFNDGEEGDRLTSAWKEGLLPGALEKLREGGKELAGGSSTDMTTGVAGGETLPTSKEMAEENFREAIRAISSVRRGGGEGGEREGGPRSSVLEGDLSRQQVEGSLDKDEDEDEDEDGMGMGMGMGIETAEMDWVKESQSLQESHVGVAERGQDGISPSRTQGPPSAALSSDIDNSLLTGIQYQSRAITSPSTAVPPSTLTAATASFPSIDPSDRDYSDPVSHSSISNHQLFNSPIPSHSLRPISYQQSSPLDSSTCDNYSLPLREKSLECHIQLPSNSRLLLDLYFTYTHVWFPILDKYDLIRLFHVVNSSSSSAKRKIHPAKTQVSAGKRALLYAVLALATTQHEGLSQPSEATPQEPTSPSSPSASALYTAAQQLVFAPGEEYNLEHVQALLLLSIINISLSHLSTAWLLIGHAGRVAVDIDLKSKTKSRFDTRTWLGYLVLETFIAVRLGREPGVQQEDWDVPAVEEDGWEEWDSWKEVSVAEQKGPDRSHGQDSGDPTHTLSVFNQLVGLSRLVRRVAGLSPPAPSQRSSQHGHNRPASNEDLSTPQTILRQLYSWSRELPPHFSFDILNPRDREMSSVPTTPHISNLHLYYAHAILELHSRCPPRLFHDSFNGMNDLAPAAALSTAIIIEHHVKSSRSLAVLPCTFIHFASFVSDTAADDEFNPLGPLENSISERVRMLKDELETTRHMAAVNFTPSNGLLKRTEAKQEPSQQAALRRSNLAPPPPRQLIDTRLRLMPQSADTSFTGQLTAMSPSRLFTFSPPASMVSPTGNIPAPEANISSHFRRPSTFSASGIDPQPQAPPDNPQSQQANQASPMTGVNIHTSTSNDPENPGGNTGINTNNTGTVSSLSMSQTAPSPDGYDEEMGMLECLPWLVLPIIYYRLVLTHPSILGLRMVSQSSSRI